MKRAVLIIAALLCMASRHPDRMPRADLVLNCSYNRGDATDRSWNAKNGTLQGNAVVTAGTRYLTVDGTGDYVSHADSDAFSFTQSGQDKPFTIMAWVWMDSSLTTRSAICFKSKEYLLELSPSTEAYKGVSITCWNSSYSAGIIGHMNSVTGISSGTWMHVCASYSGNENSTGFSLYLNGVAQSRTAVPPYGGYAGMSNTSASVQIVGASTSYQWAGRVDDARIYNRELSAAEVAAIYASGRE